MTVLPVTGKNVTKTVASQFLVMFMSEFLATAVQLFLGCLGCVAREDESEALAKRIGPIMFGLGVMAMIQMFEHISGAHANPAVTIASALFGILPIKLIGVYFLGQMLGGIAGFGLLKMFLPENYAADGFCMTEPNEDLSIYQVLSLEVILTGCICWFCCTLWDNRTIKCGSIPIKFALLVVLLANLGGPFSGPSMNTARSVGPMLFSSTDKWKYQWVYAVAPNIAPFIVVPLYKFLFKPPSENDSVKK